MKGTIMTVISEAHELLREARERLVHRRLGKDFFHDDDCNTCDFVRQIDAFLSRPSAPSAEVETVIEALNASLMSGFLFDHHDEPLNDYGKRIVRVTIRALDRSRFSNPESKQKGKI